MSAGGPLWVLWRLPGAGLPEGASVLSFLTAADEEALAARRPIVRAREAVDAVRPPARARYLRLVARFGLAKLPDGRALRQALAREGESSRWWFHPVSMRDPDGTGDKAYDRLLAFETIRAEASRLGAAELALYGAPEELRRVLEQSFRVDSRAETRARSLSWTVLRSWASRLKGLAQQLRRIDAARRLPPPELSARVALFGFWDWSVKESERGSLVDRYFKALPDELVQAGRTCAWLLWFDPDFEPGQAGRHPQEVALRLGGSRQAALLQRWLEAKDALRATFDLAPALLYMRNRAALLGAFAEEGVDFRSLFEERLLQGFVDSSMPNVELAALAAERALREVGSEVSVSFLEHNAYGRAFAEGARRAGCLPAAMQHASLPADKTFYFFEPELEFRGGPDGCRPPLPQHVFAMGQRGRELFIQAGHAPERVHLTGSARYDQLRDPRPVPDRKRGPALEVLVVVTGEVSIELDMLESAALAVRGLEKVELRCRNYPFSRIEDEPRFGPLRGAVEITRGTLEEDLARADVVLVSYSTVAEESLIAGKPVWLWRPTGYNGSALAEVEGVPRFGSAAELRRLLERFRADPGPFQPALELRRRVLERLFHRGDGGAAKRIAAVLASLSAGNPR